MALFQTVQSALGWSLRGVRVWKFSRAYLSEKPPPFSLPTQGCCFATRKPKLHLLAIPSIPMGIRALYVDLMTPINSTCPGAMATYFPRKLNITFSITIENGCSCWLIIKLKYQKYQCSHKFISKIKLWPLVEQICRWS